MGRKKPVCPKRDIKAEERLESGSTTLPLSISPWSNQLKPLFIKLEKTRNTAKNALVKYIFFLISKYYMINE